MNGQDSTVSGCNINLSATLYFYAAMIFILPVIAKYKCKSFDDELYFKISTVQFIMYGIWQEFFSQKMLEYDWYLGGMFECFS